MHPKESSPTLPVRKRLQHSPPHSVAASDAFYFVTVCTANRNGDPLLHLADKILESARFRHHEGIWFLSLLLVMPDHVHMLVHVPPGRILANVIGDWKRYLANTLQIEFQKDFFDTRIRDAAHYAEKWNYIVRNPVARGLSSTPREWPYAIAFNRLTGIEIPHR